MFKNINEKKTDSFVLYGKSHFTSPTKTSCNYEYVHIICMY